MFRRPAVAYVDVNANAFLKAVVGLHVIVLRVPRRYAAVLRHVKSKGRAVGPSEAGLAVAASADSHGLGPILDRGQKEKFAGELKPIGHGREGG